MVRKGYKTKNNNFLIYDRDFYRFVDSNGKHIRWVYETEVNYLTQVLEYVGETVLVVDLPEPPLHKTYWEYVEPSENPELSSNGGSYAYLHRIEEVSGYDEEALNGFFYITNHLYGSDYEHQGWNTERRFENEVEVAAFIEGFKVPA